MDDRMFDGHESMHGPAGGWELFEALGTFSVLLLLAGLLTLAVWHAYGLIARHRVGAGADPAEGILRERLARGEVSAGEYESTLEMLRKSQPPERRASLEPQEASSSRRTYEDYVREAKKRLGFGRNAGS